jgi:sterol desaturase/sphingolipid hydroxylase (fatty acid hydroxylase superfamily)
MPTPLPDFSQPFLLPVADRSNVCGYYGQILPDSRFLSPYILYIFSREMGKTEVGKKPLDKKQFFSELKWSLVTSVLFAVTGVLTVILWQKGFTKVYIDIHQYPLWYLPVSLIVSLLLHETYYYWLHRWMHKPAIFKVIHKVHHDSNTTSPWTAFSFHPIEGLFQAVVLPLTIMFLPMHAYVLVLQLTIMTFSSVINHLEVEVYPKGFHKSIWGKWMIGATHHSLHHKQFRYNFGLYFTFWDKWKKTESPKFNSLFEEKTSA